MQRLRLRGFTRWLAAIVLVALAIRLVYALVVMGDRDPEGDGNLFHLLGIVLGDEWSYRQPLQWLANGRDIPTAEKAPLYPFVLAVPSALGLDSIAAHRVVSCLLGASAVALIGLLGRRVGGERVGLIAAAIAAVYPALWMLDASLRSESLYLPLVALILLLAYRVKDAPSARNAALLGGAIGLATLTRGEALAFLLLLVVPLLWLLPRGARIRLAAGVVAGCLLFVGPWLARNWMAFDRPTGISTNEGGLLAGANCDPAYYTHLIGTWPCFPQPPEEWGFNESEHSSKFRRRAWDYALDNKGRVPAVAGVRVLRLWDLWDVRDAAALESGIGDRHLRAQQASVPSMYLLVLLAAVGAVSLRRRAAPLRILIAPVVLVTLTAALTYGTTRFRVAAEPAIVVLAAVGIAALWDRRARAGEPKQAELVA